MESDTYGDIGPTFECAWCIEEFNYDQEHGVEPPHRYTYPKNDLGGYDEDGFPLCESCVEMAADE